jgi:hypothetical protein
MSNLNRRGLVVWSLYATIVAFLIWMGYHEGVIQKVLAADQSHLGLYIAIAFVATEVESLFSLLRTLRFQDRNVIPDTSITEIASSTIMMVGMIATVGGIVWTFLPLIGQHVDLDIMRAHLPEIFASIAVTFIPALVSFCAKTCLDISIFIREY